MAESLIDEAARIISGQRRQDYGPVSESFARIAAMWSAYVGVELTTIDVANLMVLLKVCRARNGYHRDSFVDIIGYAALTEQLQGEPTTDSAEE